MFLEEFMVWVKSKYSLMSKVSSFSLCHFCLYDFFSLVYVKSGQKFDYNKSNVMYSTKVKIVRQHLWLSEALF